VLIGLYETSGLGSVLVGEVAVVPGEENHEGITGDKEWQTTNSVGIRRGLDSIGGGCVDAVERDGELDIMGASRHEHEGKIAAELGVGQKLGKAIRQYGLVEERERVLGRIEVELESMAVGEWKLGNGVGVERQGEEPDGQNKKADEKDE